MMRKLMEAYDLKGIQIQFEGNKIYGYRRYMVWRDLELEDDIGKITM